MCVTSTPSATPLKARQDDKTAIQSFNIVQKSHWIIVSGILHVSVQLARAYSTQIKVNVSLYPIFLCNI